MIFSNAITFVNARVIHANGSTWDSLRVRRGVIDALGSPPQRRDVVVDAQGSLISAGLINAHDHLELNSFDRLKWRETYTNVRQWIADFQPRFNTDPALALATGDTLSDRVWVGGLKNLFAGVTTVSHHNPLHRPLRRRFPVRVVRRFGLSHSLQIDGIRVATSYERTPPSWPWIVHAAEGVDAEARAEAGALDELRCLGPNTVLVHGVALDETSGARVLDTGGALVWCPSSNHFLFGATARVHEFSRARRLALGTDSRLSGDGDLLDELRAAATTRQVSSEALVRTVTTDAASVLRLPNAGRLEVGRPADLVMLRTRHADPFDTIVNGRRGDVRLTMIGGAPLFGDASLECVFTAARQPHAAVQLDGGTRLLARWIANRVKKMSIRERGLEVC